MTHPQSTHCPVTSVDLFKRGGCSARSRLVLLHSCLGALQTWRRSLVMTSHTHGERRVSESLMSLWAAVVCRQGGTHGTLMARCIRRCMRFVEAKAFFLRFISSSNLYPLSLLSLFFPHRCQFSKSLAWSYIINTTKTSTLACLYCITKLPN